MMLLLVFIHGGADHALANTLMSGLMASACRRVAMIPRSMSRWIEKRDSVGSAAPSS